MTWLTPIIVAVIMGPIVVIMQNLMKLRKENHEQHGEVANAINRIEDKLDNHIDWHLHGPLIKRKSKPKEKENGS